MTDTEQFADAENLLPFGARLQDIRGTEKAILVAYYAPDHGRDHRWVTHAPDYEDRAEEYLCVRRATGIGGVSYRDFDDATLYLEGPRLPMYDYRLVVERVLPVERTPIPYERAGTVSVECPECDAWGQTHAWKLEDYLPDECPSCGYGGEMNVR